MSGEMIKSTKSNESSRKKTQKSQATMNMEKYKKFL